MASPSPGIPTPTTDRVVTWVQMTFVDGRAYPLFALFFGYGVMQLNRLLRRRGA
jgi:uncharacterized protein